MSPADLFLRAEALPLLLAAPALWLGLHVLDRARSARLARLVGPRTRALSRAPAAGRRTARAVLLAGGTLLALAAALHPVWGEAEERVEQRGVDVVVCLDVSRSMLARDVPPDRLGRAKQEIRALCGRARGDRLALVAFAGEARLLVPLTPDLSTLSDLADLADPDSVSRGGTDLGAALEAGLAALEGARGDHEAIVLVTDGEDLGGRGLLVAETCRQRGIAVHCLGLGTALGGKIVVEGERGESFLRDRSGAEVVTAMDSGDLRRIAAATGGTFVDGSARSQALVSLYEDRIRPMARKAYEAQTRRRREDRFQWPLAAALLLWLADLALTDRRRSRPPRVSHPARGLEVAGPGPSRPRPVAARAPAAVALLLLALVGCGGAEDGRRAYREGRFADAFEAFAAAVRSAGDRASPQLLYDEALAALRVGDLEAAAAAADDAAARGGPDFAALRDFVRGNVSFASAAEAEAQAARPDQRAVALDRAVVHAEDAVAYWQRAAASRWDWPQARRNVERALLRLEALRARKAEADRQAGSKPPTPRPTPGEPPPPEAPPLPLPPPPAPTAGRDGVPPTTATAEPADLPANQVLGVLDVLARKEAEKQALRRAHHATHLGAGERDW